MAYNSVAMIQYYASIAYDMDPDNATNDLNEVQQNWEQHERIKPLPAKQIVTINLNDIEEPREVKIGAYAWIGSIYHRALLANLSKCASKEAMPTEGET